MAERSFETCNIDASFGRKTQAKSDLAATGESLQLRRAEINSSYNSYAQVWSQFMFDGGIQSRLVPAVGKSEDLLVERHDVQNRLLLPPPANRSSFTSVLSEQTDGNFRTEVYRQYELAPAGALKELLEAAIAEAADEAGVLILVRNHPGRAKRFPAFWIE